MIKLISLFALAAFAPVAMADAPPECVTPCPPGPTVTSGSNSAEAVQADVQQLRSDLRRLKARVVTLEGQQATDEATRLAEIERRLSVLEGKMDALDPAAVKVELTSLRSDLTALTGRVAALEEDMRLIKDRVTALEVARVAEVIMPRLVTFATSVGASGFAANGHDVVSDDMVFHASPSAGGAFDLSVGVLVRPEEIPMYFGASVAPRLSFDEGYGGSLIGRVGGTLGPAKGMELGLLGGVDFFHDPNLQAPDWMPNPIRQSWRGLVGAEYNYIFFRSDSGQEIGLGVEASVLPGREIEGRFLGAVKARF
ncbi:hypothetical protein KBC55_00940 [Patescibacteria group bacterium]|nr:hypothetical protein [Patescibacteria group bacterium]